MRFQERTIARTTLASAAIAFTALFIAVAMSFGAASAQASESHRCGPGSCAHAISTTGDVVTTAFDITGDGKCDTIKIVRNKDKSSYFESLSIYVNGVKKKTLKGGYNYNESAFAGVITLANGKTFLYVKCVGTNMDGDYQLLQYKSGKFKVICSDKSIKCASHRYIYDIYLADNAVKVIYAPMNYVLGAGFKCAYIYSYSNKAKTLKRTSSYTTEFEYGPNSSVAKPTVTANRNFSVYKTASCKSKKFTCKAGTKVVVTKVRVKNGKLYFKLKTSKGKTGWVKEPKKINFSKGSTYFRECYMAG